MFSIVILSKDADNLVACVQAILDNEPDVSAKQIVVVNDGAYWGCRPALNGLAWVEGIKPFVFSRNANIGLRKAFEESDAAILLNDDALLKRNRGFTSLYGTALTNPQYGLLASSTNSVGNENQLPQVSEVIRDEPHMLCFVCVLLPRSVYEQVGPLDEDFTGYGWEDNAYSESVKRAGYKLGVWDTCFVDHSLLRSTFRSNQYPIDGFHHNQMLFEQKYGCHETSK